MAVSRQLPPYDKSLAGRLLSAREAVMAPLRPILRHAGVTEQQWRVLRVLIDQGTVDVSTVTSKALLRPPSVTRIINELELRGLLTRQIDPEDGRRSVLAISASGRTLVDETTAVTLDLLDRYADALGVERLQQLLLDLALLCKAIGKTEPGSSGA